MNDQPKTEQPSFEGDPGAEESAAKWAASGRREVTLTSGLKVQILEHGKGKHLRQASRMAGPGTDQMSFSMAMVAVKALVAGSPVTLEDLLEMDDTDVLEMIGHVMGGKAKGT